MRELSRSKFTDSTLKSRCVNYQDGSVVSLKIDTWPISSRILIMTPRISA